MSDTAINKIIQSGPTADRTAFTPTPAVGSLVLYSWYDTDENVLYVWQDPAWVAINAAGGTAIYELTGDVTAGPGVGSQVATLADTAVTPASYTSADITVDSKGRITAAANGGGGSAITSLTGDVTGTGPGATATTLANTAVTPASYGDATHVAAITVDSKGRLTAASAVAITFPSDTGITQLTGDVTAGPGSGSQAATIPNDTVTYAKIQNVSAADRLLGRGNGGGSGDVQEISLGTGLSLSGTTLSSTGSGGTITSTGSPSSGNLTKWSGSASITNADLTGDVTTSGGVATTLASKYLVRQINFVVGDGVNALSTGVFGDISIPIACSITKWRILADASGAIEFDLWKDTYANYPPVVGDSMVNSNYPKITASDDQAESSSLGGWTTTAFSAGDTLRLNVRSVTTIKKASLSLELVVT